MRLAGRIIGVANPAHSNKKWTHYLKVETGSGVVGVQVRGDEVDKFELGVSRNIDCEVDFNHQEQSKGRSQRYFNNVILKQVVEVS